MILLGVGAEMLVRLMQADPRGLDTAWLLAGPADDVTVDAEVRTPVADWPLAAE